MPEIIWENRNRGYRCQVFDRGDDGIGIAVGVNFDAHTIGLSHDAALSLAQALIERCAPEPEGEWGPWIPWYGGECPLDEEELRETQMIHLDRDGHWPELVFAPVDVQDFWPLEKRVLAYRVRKPPPEPVEVWVTRKVIVDQHFVKVAVLLRNGKPTGDVRPVEGE